MSGHAVARWFARPADDPDGPPFDPYAAAELVLDGIVQTAWEQGCWPDRDNAWLRENAPLDGFSNPVHLEDQIRAWLRDNPGKVLVIVGVPCLNPDCSRQTAGR